jgi:pilus assembly protein CpaB
MRNRRTIVLLLLAVGSGLGAAFLMQAAMGKQQSLITRAAEVKTTSVVVVKMDIPQSTRLSSQHVELRKWPADYLPDGVFKTVDEVEGRVLRRAYGAGEAIQETGLITKGSAGGLQSVIAANYRAISVKVDPIVGVAGFISPGARVDVLATLRRTDWRSKQPYAKAVLQNVKVLAIDQKLEEVADGEPELVSVVTLEVKPDQAEELTFMAHEGKLQLALRSPSDEKIVKTSGVTVARLLGGPAATKRQGSVVEVVKGVDVEKKNF